MKQMIIVTIASLALSFNISLHAKDEVTVCADVPMSGVASFKTKNKTVCEHTATGKMLGYNALLDLTKRCRNFCEKLECQWNLVPELTKINRHSSKTCRGPTQQRDWIRSGWTDEARCRCIQVDGALGE